MKADLTDRAVATSKPGDLFDAKQRGLNLRTTSAGVRTWYLVFTAPTGRRARLKIGRYPEVPLARARALALESRAAIEQGIDPRSGAVGVGAAAMTVSDLVQSYLAKHVRPNLRSSKNVARRMFKNVIPVIGNVKLSELHRRDIVRCTDPVVARGAAVESLKVHKDLRAMFAWALGRGDIDASPVAGMAPPAEERVRERVLDAAEIRAVWNSEAMANPTYRTIIKLMLLTAARGGEVCGMEADELDLKTKTWTIPKERSKNKTEHLLPLSDAAIEIIKPAFDAARGGRLFLGASTDKLGKSVASARAKWGIAPWSPHDLRRSAATGLGELGVSPIVLACILGHRSVTRGSITLKVYAKYTYGKEMAEALQLWADRLMALVAGDDAAKIIPLRTTSSR